MRAIIWLGLAALAAGARAEGPANLLKNPGFEVRADGGAADWGPFEQGYALDEGVHHGGAASARCVNGGTDERRGASQTVELGQKEPAPVLVSGWSRAEGVGGFANNDYSIYVDLVYADGTPLWGQTAPFTVGTHGWQRRQVLIVPSKPLRSATIHALFRHHAGTAWFDDFSAVQLTGAGVFDSQAVAAPVLPRSARHGWFVRDVAAGSRLVPVSASARPGTALPARGLLVGRLRDDGTRTSLVVADTTGRPRALTLTYVERFDAADPVWWNDIRDSAPAGRSGERANLTRVGVGATGGLSLYPFGCVTGRGRGRMVGVPPDLGPRIVRIGYNAAARLIFVAFDLALAPANRANRASHGRATGGAAVVRRDVAPEWGFRAAAEAYYRLFPAAFERRAKAEGLWMPFTDPATVQGHQDFGFAYHEGDNSIASDDSLGILSFRYTEPMTWWMAMPPATPRTYEAAMSMVKEHLQGTNEEMRRWAQAVTNSGTWDAGGRLNVEFQNAPWTNGAVWVLNPNPALPHAPDQWTKGRLSYTPEMADRMYGAAGRGVQDGEYLDSIEGWADVLDFRPESLEYARTPPTFSVEDRRPVIPTWFSVYELAASMSTDLHRRGKLLMANSTPWRIHAFAPLLDVLGTETNWLPGGTWRPDSDAVFNLRRTLCYHKPYLLLQNTNYDQFGLDRVEKYMQRSLFYGVFPSMFSADAATSPYWQEPRWYNRDRALFQRYIPAIKRLSSAGWEPVTWARSTNPKVYVERFGRTYLTVLNDSSERARTTLTVNLSRLLAGQSGGGTVRVVDAVTGREVGTMPVGPAARLALDLGPEEARALDVRLLRR